MKLYLARADEGPEVFHSIQGEGKNLGRPSVFVRTSRCNLYCHWCDTAYTWNWEGTAFEHEDPLKYDPDREVLECEIQSIVQRVTSYDCPNVVLTGGEPMLQQPQLVGLMTALRARGRFQFDVETNGTQEPSAAFEELVDQYNVSPKLGNSKVQPKHRLREAALAALASTSKSVFKFVIATKSDLQEVDQLVERVGIGFDRCYLMPEGRSPDEIAAKREWVVEACMERGAIFTDRLHVHIWGAKRGV